MHWTSSQVIVSRLTRLGSCPAWGIAGLSRAAAYPTAQHSPICLIRQPFVWRGPVDEAADGPYIARSWKRWLQQFFSAAAVPTRRGR